MQHLSNKRGSADLTRLQVQLEAARAELASALSESRAVGADCGSACPTCSASPARRALDAAVVALRSSPPAGLNAAYVDAFVGRNRRALLSLFEQAVARKPRG